MIYGWARCSLTDRSQDIDRQVRELKKAGAEKIYLEYVHGDSVVKKQLNDLLNEVKCGDEIITLEVSRLCRSTKQLCDIVDLVKEKKICLRILGSITLDCTNGEIDPMTNAFIQMSGVFAELELKICRSRVRSGLANAKAKGKTLGRPKFCKDNIPESFYKYYKMHKDGEINISELTRLTNLARNTVYKYVKELDNGVTKY